jgi:hypothetical protein
MYTKSNISEMEVCSLKFFVGSYDLPDFCVFLAGSVLR